jgi:hypothetical protein
MLAPESLTRGVTSGLAFLPVAGSGRWLSPLGLAVPALLLLLVARSLTARAPLLDLRSWAGTARQLDLPGATLLAVALGGVILAFATADPQVQVLSPAGPWLLAVSAVAAGGFWTHARRSPAPLVPRGTLTTTPAWGSLVVSFFVGSALIAALVDIPIFARVTVSTDSQLGAALVLVRFLAALPVGALLGGWLSQRLPVGIVAAVGMALACAGFVLMTRWGLETLRDPWATVPLVLGGLGFGLAIAPVNAALLAAAEAAVHGVASALLVVARMVGMLVGIGALTTLGLRRYYEEQTGLPGPMEVCGRGVSRCEAYTLLYREAGLVELHTIFVGAAVCAAVAAVLALLLLRSRPAETARRT